MTDIVLIGYSGHAYVVIDCIRSGNDSVVGYCETKEQENNPYDLPYFGNEDKFDFKNVMAFVSIGDNLIRQKVWNRLCNRADFYIACHSTAVVSTSANIGPATLIGPSATINALSKIGNGVIINSGAIVEHECMIGNFTHIAPGAVLAGNVKIGQASFIGANSIIKQGIKIGNRVTIGAGSVVLNDIPDDTVWVGNPARKIKE